MKEKLSLASGALMHALNLLSGIETSVEVGATYRPKGRANTDSNTLERWSQPLLVGREEGSS